VAKRHQIPGGQLPGFFYRSTIAKYFSVCYGIESFGSFG